MSASTEIKVQRYPYCTMHNKYKLEIWGQSPTWGRPAP